MTPAAWIAEEHVIWLFPDGQRVPGTIAIGMPVQLNDDEAECMMALEGLGYLAFPMHGDSPLQVILLALRHIGVLIYDFLSKGGRVLDPLTGDNFGIEHLFGPLLCAEMCSDEEPARGPGDSPPPIDNDVDNKDG